MPGCSGLSYDSKGKNERSKCVAGVVYPAAVGRAAEVKIRSQQAKLAACCRSPSAAHDTIARLSVDHTQILLRAEGITSAVCGRTSTF